MTTPAPDQQPAVPAPRWRRRRTVLLIVGAVVTTAVLVVGGSYAWVRFDASGHEFTVADTPSADVALVLGAGLRPDGSPSEYLQYRLDDAAALYAAGKVKVLLVSGDNRTADHDEPTAMRDYLTAHGVPANKVCAAAVKAAWDAVWQPDPKHLGPAEDAVTMALAGS
jgi:vancomycin permeability regulator SanA